MPIDKNKGGTAMRKNVILGITGSVATIMLFKLVDKLEKNGFQVKVITTKASWLFVFSVLFRKPKKIFEFLKIWESGLLEFTLFNKTVNFFTGLCQQQCYLS